MDNQIKIIAGKFQIFVRGGEKSRKNGEENPLFFYLRLYPALAVRQRGLECKTPLALLPIAYLNPGVKRLSRQKRYSVALTSIPWFL